VVDAVGGWLEGTYLPSVLDQGQELLETHVAAQARAAGVQAALVPDPPAPRENERT
jgi:hypothetical protein